MSQKNPFGRGEILFGLDGADYLFSSWGDVWVALNTPGHFLQRHAEQILAYRQIVQNIGKAEQLRVSFDASPPIVEVVYRPNVARMGSTLVSLALWALILSPFLF